MRRTARRRKKQDSHWLLAVGRWLSLLFILALCLLAFLFFKIATLDKFSYVNRTSDDGAEIIIIDPKNDKVLKYLIPNDVLLDSAYGYGNYKLASLWKLSNNEELKGELISRTLVKNYLIPVFFWKDGNHSNLDLFQKTKILIAEKRALDYSATLDSKKLSNSILVNFVNSDFLENTPKIELNDLTGNIQTALTVSKIVEIMGGKITSNSKGYEESLDCEVYGKSKENAKIFSEVFKCSAWVDNSLQNDIKIRLGAKFAERF